MTDPYKGTWVAVFRRTALIFMTVCIAFMVSQCAQQMKDRHPEPTPTKTTTR